MRLKDLMEDQAIGFRDLASKAGVATSTVQRVIKMGKARPSTKRKLAKALGVKPSDIEEFTRENNV